MVKSDGCAFSVTDAAKNPIVVVTTKEGRAIRPKALTCYCALALFSFPGGLFAQTYGFSPRSGERILKESKTMTFVRSGPAYNGSTSRTAEFGVDVYSYSVTVRWEKECDMSCESSEVGGKSALWEAYLRAPLTATTDPSTSLPTQTKAQALSKAIRGIEESIAQKIIDGGFFKTKPRSWSAFTDEIHRAETYLIAKHSIEQGFSHEVLVTFQANNLANLGYPATKCGRAVTCRNVPRTDTTKKFLGTEIYRLALTWTNAPLLAHESESVAITYDGLKHPVFRVHSPYARYQITTSDVGELVTVNFGGLGRMQVTPSNTLVVKATYNLETKQLMLDVNDRAWNQDQVELVGTPFIRVTVTANPTGHGTVNRPQALLRDFDVPLAQQGSSTAVLLPGVYPTKIDGRTASYTVDFSVIRKGSRFFSESPSPIGRVNHTVK